MRLTHRGLLVFLSLAMEQVGIDDPDAMVAKIDEEEAAEAAKPKPGTPPEGDKKEGDE